MAERQPTIAASVRMGTGFAVPEMRVSVLLPVMDETASLRETADVVLAENRDRLAEILILVCPRTTPAALAVAGELAAAHPNIIHLRSQQRPFLGGAMRDGFDWAVGTHVLMMASDLETDPALVKELIAAANGADIVTASRWISRGGFHGYDPLKYFLNRVFQISFGCLFGTRLSDLTYGFRIFRAEWVKRIAWEESRHPFLLETLLKPLRLGARIVEIPAVWRARTEGDSHNTFWQTFSYVRLGLRLRLRRRASFWVKQ